jgi:hypothetical protein
MKNKKTWETPLMFNLEGSSTESGSTRVPGTEAVHAITSCPMNS